MPGLPQVFGPGVRCNGRLDRPGAIVRGDARSDSVSRFDRNRKIGRMMLVSVADHERQPELLAAFTSDGQADEAAPVRRHVVDVFGADFFGGHDQVTFVLAIFIIDHDDHLAGRNVGDDVFDVAERRRVRARVDRSVVRHNHAPLEIR